MFKPQYRTRRNGVPILSDSSIDFDAEKFIIDYDATLLTDPRPVDVENFAEYYLGLTPEYNYLSNCGLIMGRMVFNDTNKLPIYDAESKRAEYISAKRGMLIVDNTLLEDNSEYRLRSTVGHECGHWIYHSSYFYVNPDQLTLFGTSDKMSTACRKADIEGRKRILSSDHDWLEHHAKYFSAAFLMPKSAMKIVCGDKGMRDGLSRKFPGFEEDFLASHVAEVFNVSVESAKIRIKQLGLGFESVRNQNTTIFTIGYSKRVFSL